MNRGNPLYKQLQDVLTQRIRSGGMLPGSQVPGEMDLCREYGLSRSTVRLALGSLEEEGLIVRYQGRGTYVSSTPIPEPVGEMPFIGIVAPRPGTYLAPRILASIRVRMLSYGYGLRIYDSSDLESETDMAVRQAMSEGAVGVIIQPPQEAMFSPLLMELHNKGIPLVLFDRPYGRMTLDCVMTDNTFGGVMAGRHLLSLGHRTFAFIAESSLNTRSVQSRLDGFLDALGEKGLPGDCCTIIAIHRDHTLPDLDYWRSVSEELQGVLQGPNKPTAIFAVNDHVAMHTASLARSLGLRVPEDLAIMGFDNSEISQYFSVPLSTVEQPLESMGMLAADLLNERITGSVPDCRWVFLKPGLIIRDSCGGKTAPIEQSSKGREMIS